VTLKLRRLLPRIQRLRVFLGDVEHLAAPTPLPGMELRRLGESDLEQLTAGDATFRNLQILRLHRFGRSHAYAVCIGGQLAHISWLLPAEAMARDVPRVLSGRQDEAEITCCETLPEFRGRGAYGFAISQLARLAATDGIRRIYMKTTPENLVSQAAIRRAGLKFAGTIHMARLPGLRNPIVWPRHF
jgi:GNAT superfamily N-acetyltransferase